MEAKLVLELKEENSFITPTFFYLGEKSDPEDSFLTIWGAW